MSIKSQICQESTLELIESAYIHVPFCSYKCDFCDFAAFAGLNDREKEYFDALKKEIEERAHKIESPVKLSSIYFGGGTPGMVAPSYIEQVLKTLDSAVPVDSDVEICLETTPHAIDATKLDAWYKLGVRRLSIGIESFQEDELKSIGRDHDGKQARHGLELALNSNIPLVSMDFMYGLPTQTLESWTDTLDKAIDYATRFDKLKHISAYGLHLAENSPLYGRFPKDSSAYPDEDLFSEMLYLLMDKLVGAGFVHYEVSNFARPGFQCKHNSTYWKNKPYLAFGVGAHRYVDGVRSANWRSFNRYVRDYLFDEFTEDIDRATRIKEAIMLGLRMRKGLSLEDFFKEFGYRLEIVKKGKINELVEGDFLRIEDDYLSITDKGLPVSNSVIVELI